MLAITVAVGPLAGDAHASSQTYTVLGTSDPAPASCSGTVCPSLRDAVLAANANPGLKIQLGSATYTLSLGSLNPNESMTITGNGPGSTTIAQTDGHDRVITEGFGSSVTIEGVTISGGEVAGAPGSAGTSGGPGGSESGGGILNGGALTLRDDLVTGNAAAGGGGGAGSSQVGGEGGAGFGSAIASGDSTDPSTLTLIDTTVTGNFASGGAGGTSSSYYGGNGGDAGPAIFGDGHAAIVIDDSTVSGNRATGGPGGGGGGSPTFGGDGGGANGGVYATGPSLTIANSTIADNIATGGAGGDATSTGQGGSGGSAFGAGVAYAAAPPSTLTLTGSTVASNAATGGAGGDVPGGEGGEGGEGDGGGLNLDGQAATILNTTITADTATAGAGGTGSTPGATYEGVGGGIYTAASVTLASDTLAANGVAGGTGTQGGNLYTSATTPPTVADTIIAAGTDSNSAATANCAGTLTDDGHNLEDTTPSQCGFSGARADHVGGAPALGELASNGGPTQTLALGPASPALGTGGGCSDPTQPGNPPLAVDQRGQPRAAGACDIGAFQGQRPANTSLPAISNTPQPGQTLSCSQGAWTGDGALSFAYQWLRDGAQLAAATTAAHLVQAVDAGHQLACRVTATGTYGSASATSAVVTVSAVGGGAPVVGGAAETNKTWREGNALAKISRKRKPPLGTRFSFTLNEQASVSLSFTQKVTGRKVGAKCVAKSRKNAKHKACKRTVTVGTLSFTGHSGTNKVVFRGRISRTKKLKPGRYTLVITATNPAGARSAPKSLSFTIVK